MPPSPPSCAACVFSAPAAGPAWPAPPAEASPSPPVALLPLPAMISEFKTLHLQSVHPVLHNGLLLCVLPGERLQNVLHLRVDVLEQVLNVGRGFVVHHHCVAAPNTVGT